LYVCLKGAALERTPAPGAEPLGGTERSLTSGVPGPGGTCTYRQSGIEGLVQREGEMMEIIDITAPVTPQMPHWPGDGPPEYRWLSHTDRGDPNTVSEWRMTAHTGTHVDARSHFIPGGWGMDELDLARAVGPCRVVDLTSAEGHVERADLEHADVAGHGRLLLKTRNSVAGLMRREAFEEGYAAISKEAAEYLVEIGVETVGVDYLSVEPFDDAEFRTHHTLLGADVLVLEGLLLEDVEPGEYLLACLPLKLADSDGAPARAVLIREG
jgi:arylformamidase